LAGAFKPELARNLAAPSMSAMLHGFVAATGDEHSPFAQPLYDIIILRGPARQASRDENLQDRKE
jgi:hypothetical protein